MWGKIVFIALVLAVAVNGDIEKRKACPAKYKSLKGHSACLTPSSNAADPGVSAEEKDFILKEHLRMRREVKPAASNMRELTWDEDLAMTAQAWASACTMQHDTSDQRLSPGRFSVGQNLAMNAPKKDWKVATGGWEAEKNNFTYGGPQNGVVGHYTQCVWAETSKIGCGFAKCKSANMDMNYYVCNYGPAGNFRQTKDKPWKSGKSCGDCPSKCNDKLCDCGGQTCLNDASTDLDTCACKCKESMLKGPLDFYTGDTCELNCDGQKDPSYCGTQFPQSTCSKFANIKVDCPSLCGICG